MCSGKLDLWQRQQRRRIGIHEITITRMRDRDRSCARRIDGHSAIPGVGHSDRARGIAVNRHKTSTRVCRGHHLTVRAARMRVALPYKSFC